MPWSKRLDCDGAAGFDSGVSCGALASAAFWLDVSDFVASAAVLGGAFGAGTSVAFNSIVGGWRPDEPDEPPPDEAPDVLSDSLINRILGAGPATYGIIRARLSGNMSEAAAKRWSKT
jgi:hypothetical protein